MSDKRELEVIPIDPDARYVLMWREYIPDEEKAFIRDKLREWWSGDDKFLVVCGDAKLGKIENA